MYEYSWVEFGADIKKITEMIRQKGRKFTGIYCASEGGHQLASVLAGHFELPLSTKPPIERDRDGELVYNPDIMIVDDVANTGLTLGEFHRAGFFIVTIFRNPEGYVTPDVYAREKDTRYIVFPWQKEKPPKS